MSGRMIPGRSTLCSHSVCCVEFWLNDACARAVYSNSPTNWTLKTEAITFEDLASPVGGMISQQIKKMHQPNFELQSWQLKRHSLSDCRTGPQSSIASNVAIVKFSASSFFISSLLFIIKVCSADAYHNFFFWKLCRNKEVRNNPMIEVCARARGLYANETRVFLSFVFQLYRNYGSMSTCIRFLCTFWYEDLFRISCQWSNRN